MIKFLKESEYSIKEEALKISGKCRQFTSSEQAHMLNLMSSSNISDRIELSKYALENCVTSLNIEKVKIDHVKFANYADLSDEETLKVYLAVGELCSIANRLDEESEKK